MISAATPSDSFFRARSGFVKPASKRIPLFGNIISVLNRNEKVRFSFLVVADLFISVLDILSLALLLWIIQYYIQPGTNRSLSFLPGWMLDGNSIALIASFFLLFSAKNLFAFYMTGRQNKFIAHVTVRISKNRLAHYQNAEFEEFINVDSSVHIRKIAYQPFDFCQQMLAGVQQIITQGSLILIAIVAIIFFNAKLFILLLLILLPPVIAVFYFLKKRLTKARLQIRTSNQLSLQYLMDALKGFVEGNIYDRNRFFLRRFISHRRTFSLHLFNSISIQTMPARLIEIFAVMGLFILIVIARWGGASDSGALITIGAFMAAAYKIIPGMVKIVNTLSQMKAHEFSLDEINTQNHIARFKTQPGEQIQSLQVSKLSFQYKNEALIKDLSFSLQQGDFIGVSGKSGKGKTTLFNLLLGFLSPATGTISINGMPLSKEEIRDFWPSVSYVRQQSFFIHDSLLRNIILEEEDYDEVKLQTAIKISGLEDLIASSPEGIHKLITENGKNISGGQQQRVALARALYKDAGLILLDEPFNELDEASELSLLHHFKELAQSGKIVLMITHNRQALSFCNKIISLDE